MDGMPGIETRVGVCCLFAESGFMAKDYCTLALDGVVLKPVLVWELVCQ